MIVASIGLYAAISARDDEIAGPAPELATPPVAAITPAPRRWGLSMIAKASLRLLI
jgi:hypothetical protein